MKSKIEIYLNHKKQRCVRLCETDVDPEILNRVTFEQLILAAQSGVISPLEMAYAIVFNHGNFEDDENDA